MLLSEIKNSLGYSLPLLSCLSIINMVDEENEKEIVDLLERGVKEVEVDTLKHPKAIVAYS